MGLSRLEAGLYETLRTVELERRLREAEDFDSRFGALEDEEAPDILARHVADAVRRALADRPAEQRLDLVNQLLSTLGDSSDQVVQPEQLLALTRHVGPGAQPLLRPATPLSEAALLTNSTGEPSLGAELRAELTSSDRVDLLCAFIRWHGLRVLEEPLRQLKERGVPVRVITTTYVGATERRALDELVRRFDAEVKISYETQSTRLHAKAWLLRRSTGYDTAYVGSSNLSRSALVEGLEWNVRLSAVATPTLLRKFEATFDSYWADAGFLAYDPDADAERLDRALAEAGGRTSTGSTTITLAGLEVRPMPHQVAMLEALDAERQVHNRHRNLVVAATGTGKTVLAALDYKRLADDGRERPSLLFVAHRKEILEQSLRTYREVLADGAFGELHVGGERPSQWRHVFASVQSLAAFGIENLPPDHFDVVVIDEFHHAEAPTYRRLLDHLKPAELLGLTATPERADGIDVKQAFFDGRSAYELRLWDALEADLLVPFHYFGVADDVDLRGIEWKRGSYDVEGLSKLYTGNDRRAAKILSELRDKVTDVGRMRALGFCVSVDHAKYMARVFNQAGIPAVAVSGETQADDRARALQDLRDLRLNALFAADLFNEGLDLPVVDTVMLLRPTQSATIFLQQIGRGLRRAPGKAVLTVFDFIGQQRREFRFDVRYRALTGTSRRQLESQIQHQFPFLPGGCQIVLDRVASSIVLDNVRSQLRLTRKGLVSDVRSYGDLSLASYLHEAGRELVDVYKGNSSWTALRRDAGLPTLPSGPDEEALLKRASRFVHVDDPERARVYQALASIDGPTYEELTEREQRLARMLFFTLWPNRGGFDSYQAGLDHLRRHPAVCAELRELVAYAVDAARHLPLSLGEGLQHVPLYSHSRYRREEILAGLGWANLQRPPHGRSSGADWCEDTKTDALMFNLRKTEREFSPTTMYHDYAISPDLFHWESPNTASPNTTSGHRYIHHLQMGTCVLLFARESRNDDLGAAPFTCLGQGSYKQHEGERPISITWGLSRAMPPDTFRVAAVAAG